MQYRILGELEVNGAKGALTLAAPRQRMVLAVLLIEANHPVPVERLVDAVWGEQPPSTSRGQIQICVSALRRGLAEAGIVDAIHTRGPGYMIEVGDGQLDLHVFDQIVTTARAAATNQQLTVADALYGQARALWRGRPFADMDSDLIQGTAVTLRERHLALIEDSIMVRLQLGLHHELIGELMSLTAEHPVRERLQGQLMTALYRAGRQAEALEVYQRARRVLVDEFGLEPSAELQRLERSILTSDPDLDVARQSGPDIDRRPAAPPAVPRLLPADISDFTGHDDLVETLRRSLAASQENRTSPVAAISGKGGVGKTTLAIHVAHQLADDFPDGQLFIYLRGGDSQPVAPTHALARFLRALGLPGTAIPEGVDERAELYRDRLAGRRMVVVLDDACGEDQIAPLLPGTGTSTVIITSRLRLTRLPGARQVDLGVLGPDPAVALLCRIAGHERVMAEPESARLLVLHCDGLPLALRLAGARLAARPHWTLARLVARLDDEHRRLDELAHGGVDIRSNIAVAYTGLPATAQLLFRRLGMLELADFDLSVAIPLLDRSAQEAEDTMEALVDAQLLDVEGTGDVSLRYRFHDLVRVFARERLAAEDPPDVRRAALQRVIGSWVYLAREAHRRIYGGDFTVLHGTAELYPLPSSILDDLLAEPMDWYERERESISATIRHAADAGMEELCWDLAISSVTLFETRSYQEDWRETHEVALAATRRAGNRRGEAAMLYSLGSLSIVQQRFDDAHDLLSRALAMFTEWGDTHACGLAQRNLAYRQRISGDTDAALALYEAALANLETAGDAIAQAHVLGNIAQVKLERLLFDEAEDLLTRALAITQQVGAKRVEAQIRYRLGDAYLRRGKLTESIAAFRTTLAMVNLARDPIGEAYALFGLGHVHMRLDRYREAASMFSRAYVLADEASERMLLAKVMLAQGCVHEAMGRTSEALDRASAARELSRQIDAPLITSRAEQLIRRLNAVTG